MLQICSFVNKFFRKTFRVVELMRKLIKMMFKNNVYLQNIK